MRPPITNEAAALHRVGQAIPIQHRHAAVRQAGVTLHQVEVQHPAEATQHPVAPDVPDQAIHLAALVAVQEVRAAVQAVLRARHEAAVVAEDVKTRMVDSYSWQVRLIKTKL